MKTGNLVRKVSDGARLLLGGIRLVNGALGLFAPALIQRQMGRERPDPSTDYGLRLFGIRTILIALDLLVPASKSHAHAIRVAPLIHISDTVAAWLTARSGALPKRAGTTLVAISAVNTVLSLLMQLSRDRS